MESMMASNVILGILGGWLRTFLTMTLKGTESDPIAYYCLGTFLEAVLMSILVPIAALTPTSMTHLYLGHVITTLFIVCFVLPSESTEYKRPMTCFDRVGFFILSQIADICLLSAFYIIVTIVKINVVMRFYL